MGCFGYLCSVCNKQIVGNCFTGGEHSILIHKRHGLEVGRTVGHYNEYGGTLEDELYRSDKVAGPNSHDEICDSEMSLADSKSFHGRKMVRGTSVPISDMKSHYVQHLEMRLSLEALKNGSFEDYDFPDIWSQWDQPEYEHEKKFQEYLDSFEDVESLSGTVACHFLCYQALSEAEKGDLKLSESDPDQSWGKINPIHK